MDSTMPSQATSPPLTVTLLAAMWVSLSRCSGAGSPGSGCDNGKLSVEMDLPLDAVYWDCEVSAAWPESAPKRQSIDTVYDPEPARQICMDESISYNLNIPNSGAYRPVNAESGEYVYCPPQRWLNNLHHGATVLLYHPCAPHHERHLLSMLARSCLSDYIISPHPQLSKHMPLAVVSWGRTLELSSAATSDICDWMETTQTTRNKSDGTRRKYNLLLTRPAALHRQQQSTTQKDSLRQCCEQTIASLLSVTETELEPRMNMEHVKKSKDETKNRQIRAAIRGNQVNVESLDTTSKNTSSFLTSPNNRTNPQRTDSVSMVGPSAASPILKEAPQSKIPNQGPTFIPANRSDSLGYGTSPSQKSTLMQANSKPSDLKNPHSSAGIDMVNIVQTHTARPEALTPKDNGTESNKDSVKVKEVNENHVDKDHKTEGKIKHNKVVDVKEREVEHKQVHSTMHAHHKNKNSGSDSVSKSLAHSESHLQQNPQTQPNSRDCDGCKASEHCDCTKAPGPEARSVVVNKGLLRTPRTDEAVWAAAALGFLLVLLTLSVLHTRLYRHWRTTPSLYWHDPRQDYDSVADVIRRRLQIAKKRRKRGRRQECVLLPSSSSSDEYP